MSCPSRVSFIRCAFCILVVAVIFVLITCAMRDGYHKKLYPAIWPRQLSPSVELASPALPWSRSPALSRDQLANISAVDLLTLHENMELAFEGLYFGIVEQTQATCPHSARIGDSGDGGWDVCFSSPYNITKSKPCVAFSFGINHVWGYDDELADKYKCIVYMFDPSMSALNDHQRRNTSWFYRAGLSSENKVQANGWKMRTLCTLFKELGYSGKTVDILKIDVDYWEWASFEKALQEGCLTKVKQLLFETHTSELQVHQKSDYSRFIRVWRGLFNLGFRTWKWHKNPKSVFYKSHAPPHVKMACCYEHFMLNTRFTKP